MAWRNVQRACDTAAEASALARVAAPATAMLVRAVVVTMAGRQPLPAEQRYVCKLGPPNVGGPSAAIAATLLWWLSSCKQSSAWPTTRTPGGSDGGIRGASNRRIRSRAACSASLATVASTKASLRFDMR
jgi:hypothetical protein